MIAQRRLAIRLDLDRIHGVITDPPRPAARGQDRTASA
jgi:hypothetical protein